MGRLNGLDLFSGIAGNTLALNAYIKTIAYCEQDRHAQAVLLSRMADGSIEPAPIWDDITSLRGDHFDLPIDIIVGGPPCQDISLAGRGKGLAGERSGLVFEVFRLIGELKPSFVFLENVPAIRTRGGERVVKELAALGYDCRWDCLSAFDVGAPHKRERWFLLAANTNGSELRNKQMGSGGTSGEGAAFPRLDGQTKSVADTQSIGRSQGRPEPAGQQGRPEPTGSSSAVGDADQSRLEIIGTERSPDQQPAPIGASGGITQSPVRSLAYGLPKGMDLDRPKLHAGNDQVEQEAWLEVAKEKGLWWSEWPGVSRTVGRGVPYRVDQVKRLGNAVVPLQAREAFERLLGLKESPR